MKKINFLLCLFLLMSGCQRKVIDETNTGIILDKTNADAYAMVVPFKMSETRIYHPLVSRSGFDFDNIGQRLTNLSKDYFPTSEYYMSEGSVISYSDLTNKFVKRVSETNEIGLNPEKGEMFPSGISGVEIKEAVIVSDVIEQDFYKKTDGEYNLAGMSIAIVMDAYQNTGNSVITISDNVLFEYGSTMARKLERYLRTITASKKIPILMTLYVNGKSGSYIPGHMIGKAYFKDKSPSVEKLNEKWILFPSTESNQIDTENHTQFTNFKNAIQAFILEDVGVVGYGFYEANELHKLKITIQFNASTYMERLTLISYASELMKTFNNSSFDIEITIKSQSETKTIILKNANAKEVQVVNLS